MNNPSVVTLADLVRVVQGLKDLTAALEMAVQRIQAIEARLKALEQHAP